MMLGVNLIYLEYYETSKGDNPVKEYIMNIDSLDEVADIMETIGTVDLVGASYLVMLHACYKQKGKAEKNDIDTGKRSMKVILAQEKEKTQRMVT